MKRITVYSILVCIFNVDALNLPGPLVYVVTPSTQLSSANEGRSAPFYYRNWMRRMDPGPNSTSTTTPSTKTPDLIFAEFESESGNTMRKSIRKLLENERVELKTSTSTTKTSRPIYVTEEEDFSNASEDESNHEDIGLNQHSGSDYFTMYNNLYNNVPNPIYLPSTTQSTTTRTTTTTSAPTTPMPITSPAPMNVENIWHIIDNEKHDEYGAKWNEVPINSDNEGSLSEISEDGHKNNAQFDENFALPGFGTNPGNGAENESRAIRTEPNIRFPYVSLKPFQMKKPLLDVFSNSKKGNNMFTNLDNFQEVKNPVRGEAQDVVSMRLPIDRYNPAQPYLPQEYGSKSKQSSPSVKSVKTVANLVPPPPPPAPQLTADDFPAPTSYESFPPYPPSKPDSSPVLPPPSLKPPVSVYQPSSAPSDDSIPDDGPPVNLGYRYKPPSSSAFVPTVQPISNPFSGYSYDKPMNTEDINLGGYSYNKPTMTLDSPPPMDTGMNGYSYSKPQPPMSADKPVFSGYHYDKPESPIDHPAPPESHSYGGNDVLPFHHDSDLPELIFDKPHETKDSDDAKDIGMMPPPPPPADMKPDMDAEPPSDDHGFPHDFPGDFKYHDFDHDHDFYHHHHHTTTTTTTTTEMPRVNRYSYYYLGKKLYYLPLYFSVYFIVYVGALIIKAVLRHKIVYPNSWRPNDQTASFFSKRSVSSWDLSNENLHEVTGRVTKAIAEAADKYMTDKYKSE